MCPRPTLREASGEAIFSNREERPPALSKLKVSRKPAMTGLGLDGPSILLEACPMVSPGSNRTWRRLGLRGKRRNNLDGLGFNTVCATDGEKRAPAAARAAFSARNEQPLGCGGHKLIV